MAHRGGRMNNHIDTDALVAWLSLIEIPHEVAA